MSEEQFRFIGARFDDLERHMKVLAEANLMTRECLSAEIQETNKRIDGVEANLGRFAVRVDERFDKLETETNERIDGLEANLGRFAVRVGERFDKLETETAKRFDKLETETAKRFDKLETGSAETRQQLEAFRDDTQQRLKCIEGHLSLKSTSSSRTPPRATPTSLTKRLKKS
ncbi:MAG TPA: hypothetical protein VGD80_29475 [Kofleriaceae bacterium]